MMTVSVDFWKECIMRMPMMCRAQATDSMIKHKVAYCPSSIEPRPAALSNSPEEHFVCTPDTPLLCASDDRASTHMDTQSSSDRLENQIMLYNFVVFIMIHRMRDGAVSDLPVM